MGISVPDFRARKGIRCQLNNAPQRKTAAIERASGAPKVCSTAIYRSMHRLTASGTSATAAKRVVLFKRRRDAFP
jgi:hypothetical protein